MKVQKAMGAVCRARRFSTITLAGILATIVIGCAVEDPVGAGFRYSVYGPDRNPGPEYWARVGQEMAARFDGAVPEALWIVGRLDGEGTRLNFPVETEHPLIGSSAADANEATLTLFDELGLRVWLQVEPGHAPVEDLIHLVLDRYQKHPSVVGFGVDVEWYQSTQTPDGKAIDDEEARTWVDAVRSHSASYRLFLKHWEAGKMPPTVRDGLLFVDDSQILPSLEAMVHEFATWGRTFAPAPVAFQYGYPSDRPWWRRLADPPGDIGRAILDAVPNTKGLYWVDFTVLDVFLPEDPSDIEALPYFDPTPRPQIGIKIYEYDGDLTELFDRWDDLGINAAFVSEGLASRDRFRTLARENGTPFSVIFPVLFAPNDIRNDPNLIATTATGEPARDHWVEFACPSRETFRRRRVEQAVEFVTRLRPDGISLDFMRYFGFWEMVGPEHDSTALPDTCYCRTCLEKFAHGLDKENDLPLDDPPTAARWIETHAAEEWVKFKTETITSLAWQIIEAVRAIMPSIRINLHTVPWRTEDFDGAILRVIGQDRDALGSLADTLSPMCYSFMLHRPPEWIASVVEDTAEQGRCPVLPSIQIAEYYRNETMSTQEVEDSLRAALEPPSAGVVLWRWDMIERDQERYDLIRKVLQETK